MVNIWKYFLLVYHLQLCHFKLAPDRTAVNQIIQMMYLLGLTGSKRIPEKLDCCRGVYKPTVRAHHQSKQATQLLHEGNVPFLLQQKSSQLTYSFRSAIDAKQYFHISINADMKRIITYIQF